MGPSEVTLQINVAPTDFPHARYTLAHQLGVWGGQVQEILFTYDLHRTERGGRFGEGWQERRGPMEELLASLCARHPHARVAEVDYSPAAAAAVAETFTGGRPVPPKDTKGAPYYPYFAGLHEARFDLIVHMDSDVMFGGASQTWVGEGCELLARDAAVLACGPLPGPPASDGRLRRRERRNLPARLAGLQLRLPEQPDLHDRSQPARRARLPDTAARPRAPGRGRQGPAARQSALPCGGAGDRGCDGRRRHAAGRLPRARPGDAGRSTRRTVPTSSTPRCRRSSRRSKPARSAMTSSATTNSATGCSTGPPPAAGRGYVDCGRDAVSAAWASITKRSWASR